ncbi:MAG: DSD1 family PLP-dependent enzyme [Pseudomonadota bacterium]
MQPPPARPGDPFEAIDTPALIVDLDRLNANLDMMAAHARANGYCLRPHAKTHKSPVIGRMQIQRGAVGVCVQKVSEAEIMIEGGVGDVLVSNEVASPRKLARLAQAARQARVGVCVDDASVVSALSRAASAAGAEIQVLVEIDVGQGRCGVVTPEDALVLGRQAAAASGLRLRGIQAYHGSAQHIHDIEERRRVVTDVAGIAARTRDLFLENGLACDIIGGAGTGTFTLDADLSVHTELQPGSYIFMDADYGGLPIADPKMRFEQALFVLSHVMSRPVAGRAVIDAGHKASAIDSGLPAPYGLTGVAYVNASDEHGVLEGADDALPGLGERVLLVPGHCDPTVNLHDHYVAVRGLGGPQPIVEAVWPVAARGAGF